MNLANGLGTYLMASISASAIAVHPSEEPITDKRSRLQEYWAAEAFGYDPSAAHVPEAVVRHNTRRRLHHNPAGVGIPSGRRIALVAPSPSVRRILSVLQLECVMPIFDTLEEAWTYVCEQATSRVH